MPRLDFGSKYDLTGGWGAGCPFPNLPPHPVKAMTGLAMDSNWNMTNTGAEVAGSRIWTITAV